MKLTLKIAALSVFALALSAFPVSMLADTTGSGNDCGKGNKYHSSGKSDPSCHKGGDNGGGNGGGNNGGGNGGNGGTGNGGNGGNGGQGGNGGNGGNGGTGNGFGGNGGVGTGIGVGVGIGQGGSATGGSVSNSGNSSNTNTTSSGASAGATAGASNNSSGNTVNSTYTEQRQTPMAYAPDALPTAPCFKTYSAGASSPFFGAALGGGRIDKGCDARETARSFALLHNFTAAAKILCSTDAAKRAKLTLDDCLALVPEVTPVAAPVPTRSEPAVVVIPLTTPAPVAAPVPAPAVAVTPAPVATPFETKKISE